ncbi:hypothetical protein L1049_019261 [Liquidambar formosana]|uniref:Seipin n=1 Tax=Liquidambar formosana TaxID=63359 RepID=A0AAP0SBG7_LIQFO
MHTESCRRAEETKDTVKSVVHAAAKVPSSITHGSTLLLRKLAVGLIGAVYVCMVLLMVMILAAVIGVGLVQLWVEEPVFVRERLNFDYTDVHPKAAFSFGGGSEKIRSMKMGVPVGHTIYVSIVLLMPDSDFNREIGVFQLSAELLSNDGDVVAKTSQPCMMPFRSLPVRLTRTFLLSVPLILGISSETQKLTVQILRHKEGKPRTRAIRVTLSPRAGTLALPQLYEAEILINSQLPWRKEVVHNWKWTFYVWTSFCVYILLLIFLVCHFKQLILRMTIVSFSESSERDSTTIEEVPKEPQARGIEDREISELMRKWRRSRSKRKLSQVVLGETVGSSASSISMTREDTSTVAEEDMGDSESVCFGG